MEGFPRCRGSRDTCGKEFAIGNGKSRMGDTRACKDEGCAWRLGVPGLSRSWPFMKSCGVTAHSLLLGRGDGKKGLPEQVKDRAPDMPTQDELDGIDQSTIGKAPTGPAASSSVHSNARRVCATSGELAAAERTGVWHEPGDIPKWAAACEGLLMAVLGEDTEPRSSPEHGTPSEVCTWGYALLLLLGVGAVNAPAGVCMQNISGSPDERS